MTKLSKWWLLPPTGIYVLLAISCQFVQPSNAKYIALIGIGLFLLAIVGLFSWLYLEGLRKLAEKGYSQY